MTLRSSPGVAALPMYDLPELHEATDALWAALASRLQARGVMEAPPSLHRDASLSLEELWTRPDLVLAQTCGYPLTHALAGRVRLVGTPCYRAAGCEGATYRSQLVVQETWGGRALGELRGTVCAINDRASHSGMNVLRAELARHAGGEPFFASVVVTGSHVASLAAVQRGDADVAAIDAVTHALLAAHRPAALLGTRVLASSAPAPGLPLVTAASASDARVDALRAALADVLADPGLSAVRDALLLDGVQHLDDRAYDAILQLERDAVAAGYPELA